MKFMKNLIAHPVACIVSEFPLSRHLVKSFDLAGRGDSAPLSGLRVISVTQISCGKAGTCGTGYRTAAAGDTPLVKLSPHGMLF